MSPPQPAYQHHIRRYFYSGWAFLMPYLFAYLLYYVMKWPVNPSGKTPELQISNSWVPCMLHVYWVLHTIHVILAGYALWRWWKQTRILQEETERTETEYTRTSLPQLTPVQTNHQSPISDIRPLTSGLWPLAIQLAPWALLALLFYIPGVYLEWPSDPWEHLRRINEWRILDTVGAHSSWIKSSYFIPYSLLSWCIGLRQLFWLDFYYTGICLLLCWQYYRFSRACGLGERASMVFVIIQALLFGNNIFSFYRYYGISSSIYAQLGAVALTRIVLQFAARGTILGTILQEETERTETGSSSTPLPQLSPVQTNAENTVLQKATKLTKDEDIPLAHESGNARPLNVHRSAFSVERSPIADLHPSTIPPLPPYPLSLKPQIIPLITAVTCLLALTALNHPQGLGIAGLGIAAVIVWRLIEWKRSALWWLIGGTLVINALFLWLYPRPAIIETYRAQGWLNA
ncbi:MAG: hypothetical protein IPP19_03895 [Verrucomicrobia bacterium]|nr:hypothetical protein [Verrucomicrobiota bacterium]